MATIPSPILDDRNEDQVVAEVIGAFPDELSDRSDSNPAVVIVEAIGAFFGKIIYQLNRWPRAVLQKLAAWIGLELIDASAATVTQDFTLSAPQPTDTIIPTGTGITTEDGSVTFETTSDLTILASATQTGTIALVSGSATVTGTGTAFPTGNSWVGWQIRVLNGTWYTIESVASTTSLTLTEPATSNVSTTAFEAGPISGSVQAQATTSGIATNVGADTLTVLASSPNGVASTTNASAASGGADAETAAQATARAPDAFAARDVCISDADYAQAAQRVLGRPGRALALGGYDLDVATPGYTTVALLSPTWSVASAASTAERAAVVRDLAGRTVSGITTVDTPANIQSFATSVVAAFVRKRTADALTARIKAAQAINGYFNPSTYDWGRPIYVADQVQVVEDIDIVDRIHTINSVPAVGLNYQTATQSWTFAASASVTAHTADTALMAAADTRTTPTDGKGITFIVDVPNSQVYLVMSISGATLTLDRAWAGATGARTSVPWFTSIDTALDNWYSLPYANLTTETTAPAPTMIVVDVAS